MERGATHVCVGLTEADPGALAGACAVLTGLGLGAQPERVDGRHAVVTVGDLAASGLAAGAGAGFALRDGMARARAALAELRHAGVAGCCGGVGPQRVLALLAADLAEAGAVFALTRADVPGVLWPLPVERLAGIGGATAAALRRSGILTVGDVVAAGPGWLGARFGARSHELWSAALGRDATPAASEQRRRGA